METNRPNSLRLLELDIFGELCDDVDGSVGDWNENGELVKKRPGPKCKTENFSPKNSHSPLKLTIKRLPTCHAPAFEVVNKKKGRVTDCAAMDEMIQALGGVTSPHPQTPSPTPSEILRPEVNADSDRSSWESLAISFGFLAPPESLDSPADQEEGEVQPAVNGNDSNSETENGNKEDSGSSSTGDPEPSESPSETPSLPTPSTLPAENGNSEMDSESDTQKNMEQESSDSGCEKDESEKDFTVLDRGADCTPPAPAIRSPVGSLTVLAPSALNSSIVNGSLPPEPLDINTVSETFSNLSNETTQSTPPPLPPPAPIKEGLTILSPAALGATTESVNLLNINTTSNDPLGLLRSYMEPNTSYMQETCEVQRLPVPYGMPPGIGTPPPSVSPSFQQRSSPVYRGPSPINIYPPALGQTPPPPLYQGIQARQFALQTSPSTIRPDGSPAVSPTLPPGLGRSISISPSTKPTQKRTTSSPIIESTPKRSRPDSPDDCQLVDVQQKMPTLPSSISLTVRGSNDSPLPVRNKESSGVANILASRGITVTPAVNKSSAPQNARINAGSSSPVTTLNLSSAVSIVPANQARSQFAVPQGRSMSRQIDRQVRPPTVDLTQDSPPVFRRNRPQRFTCQVCDKVFTTQETLNQHLTTHRSPGKLPYKCNLCNAQYPTQQGLLQHKQTYHKEAQGSEMALPVVDIKHPGTIQKLSSLGIRHCLVLTQLGNSSGGVFGLPIVAIDNARNPAICNLGALGASNVLSLGPAKALR